VHFRFLPEIWEKLSLAYDLSAAQKSHFRMRCLWRGALLVTLPGVIPGSSPGRGLLIGVAGADEWIPASAGKRT